MFVANLSIIQKPSKDFEKNNTGDVIFINNYNLRIK